eukprot:jgi/Mesen1/6495/ME000332S05500
MGNAMGSLMGKITEETPKYDVVTKTPEFEIRQYAPALVAEVKYKGDVVREGVGKGFMALANYIGALGTPNNLKPGADSSAGGEKGGEKIAMTAPVITSQASQAGGQEKAEGEKIAMTAPVITSEASQQEATMQFVLPSKYTMETIPKPTNPDIHVKEIPAKKMGVMTFSGSVSKSFIDAQAQKLKAALEGGGHTVQGGYQVAQYNPPWTLWFLRTNEVMFPVE